MKWLRENLKSLFSREDNLISLAGIDLDTDSLDSDYVDPVADKDSSASAACDLQCKQAAVLYAGIANQARLSEQDEEEASHRLTQAIKVMMSHVADNNGRIVHLGGDAILAEFKDADNALHCAINLQLSARQWNAYHGGGPPVLFRISLSLGDETSDQEMVYGDAVDLASRLEKLARSGGICVSDSLMRGLDDHSSIRLLAMEEQCVKSVNDPEQAFWIEFDSHEMSEPEFTNAIKVSALTS